MVTEGFSFSRTPKIVFGAGKISTLPALVESMGGRVVLLTGGRSLRESGTLDRLTTSFSHQSIRCEVFSVSGEPSPEQIDAIVGTLHNTSIDAVAAIGGGSVIDAGKAVSAMLGKTESVQVYLEGVGTREHDGSKVPFIAVPTTAGTGSEATKNAVLSRVGPGGFKKSLRHDNFVPDVALIDPTLAVTCPKAITAACGMDAVVQLLESYVSTAASPMTDALAISGLKAAAGSFPAVCDQRADDIAARAAMAYAALLSGITLANAGLGVVHGIAAAAGGLCDIPHGVVCGTLIGPATRATIAALRPEQTAVLEKYATVGRLLSGERDLSIQDGCECLVELLTDWANRLDSPRLGDYGIGASDIETIAAQTGSKNNPAVLSREAIAGILQERV